MSAVFVFFAAPLFAQSDPAYIVMKKGMRRDLVSVDGTLYSTLKFAKFVRDKSPAASEQMKYYLEKKGEAGGSWFFGVWAGIAGVNKYRDSGSTSDPVTVAHRQAEGLITMAICVVFLVNSHATGIAADGYLQEAVKQFNKDTGRVKVSLGAGRRDTLALSASWRF